MPRLVLTRKLNESVVIHKDGEQVALVSIAKIDRNQVRVAFEADSSIQINRIETIKRDKEN